MKYKLLTIVPFNRQLKRLAKKYPSIFDDLEKLSRTLSEEPNQGTPIGKNCYKIRLAIASKGKGKSGVRE